MVFRLEHGHRAENAEEKSKVHKVVKKRGRIKRERDVL